MEIKYRDGSPPDKLEVIEYMVENLNLFAPNGNHVILALVDTIKDLDYKLSDFNLIKSTNEALLIVAKRQEELIDDLRKEKVTLLKRNKYLEDNHYVPPTA